MRLVDAIFAIKFRAAQAKLSCKRKMPAMFRRFQKHNLPLRGEGLRGPWRGRPSTLRIARCSKTGSYDGQMVIVRFCSRRDSALGSALELFLCGCSRIL